MFETGPCTKCKYAVTISLYWKLCARLIGSTNSLSAQFMHVVVNAERNILTSKFLCDKCLERRSHGHGVGGGRVRLARGRGGSQ